MKLFGRRRAFDQWVRVDALGVPDWNRIGDELDDDERIGAENGWFVASESAPVNYGTDQPCTVFLTKYRLYVDVRPDASLMEPIRIKAGIYNTEAVAVGRAVGDKRNHRFGLVYATNYGPDGKLYAITVDFKPMHQEFVNSLGRYGETFAEQTAFTKSMINEMPPSDED